jgi:hypothetical protein
MKRFHKKYKDWDNQIFYGLMIAAFVVAVALFVPLCIYLLLLVLLSCLRKAPGC